MTTMALSSLSRTLLSAPKQKPIPKKTNGLMSSPSLTHTPPKKVLVPIGFGSEEMEAVIIVDVLRRAGADVLLASVEKELEVEGSLGTKIVADAYVSDCADEVFDLVALPGGMPGSVRLRDCEILRTITTNQAEEKRFYGAICAAPAVALKPWGLLKKKQVSSPRAVVRGQHLNLLSFVEQLFGGGTAADVGGKLLMPNVGGPRKDEFNQVEWSFDRTPHVIIPIANGCEETEVIALVDILRRAKVDVVVASVEKTLKIVASQQTMIIADKFIEEASDSIYDLVILPGGVKGAERLQKSKILKRLLKEQKAAGRVYGGFGSSLAILQKQGLLMGLKARFVKSG